MNTSVQQIPTSVDPQFKDTLNSINSYKQFVTKINIRLIQLNELGANPPLKLWDNQATKVSIKKDYLEYINSLNNRTFTPTQKAILDKMPDIFEEHNKNLELSKIESSINKKAKIEFCEMQPGDVKNTYADIKHSKKLLGYEPKTSISNGIPLFIDWYKEYKGIQK